MLSRHADERQNAGWFVLVPLDHEHPQREVWLRVAAKGRVWIPSEEELLELYSGARDAPAAHDHRGPPARA